MNSEWMDELQGHDSLFDDDVTETFYCPYTNGPECALLSKGWQVQELCEALECEQLKLFQHGRMQDEAA